MQGLLVLHILGAIVTFGLVTVSIYSLLKNTSKYFKKLFLSLAGVSIFQVGTGVGLFIQSDHKSILGFCLGLGFYLSAVILIQSMLLVRLRKLKTQPA